MDITFLCEAVTQVERAESLHSIDDEDEAPVPKTTRSGKQRIGPIRNTSIRRGRGRGKGSFLHLDLPDCLDRQHPHNHLNSLTTYAMI